MDNMDHDPLSTTESFPLNRHQCISNFLLLIWGQDGIIRLFVAAEKHQLPDSFITVRGLGLGLVMGNCVEHAICCLQGQ